VLATVTSQSNYYYHYHIQVPAIRTTHQLQTARRNFRSSDDFISSIDDLQKQQHLILICSNVSVRAVNGTSS